MSSQAPDGPKDDGEYTDVDEQSATPEPGVEPPGSYVDRDRQPQTSDDRSGQYTDRDGEPAPDGHTSNSSSGGYTDRDG